MNNIIIIIFIYLILSTKVFSNPNINARTGILVDYHSDEILYEFDSENPDLPCINDQNNDLNNSI